MDLESGRRGIGLINPAQDQDEWRAVVNRVMNFRLPQSEV